MNLFHQPGRAPGSGDSHRQRQPLSPVELAHQVSPIHMLGKDIGRVLRHGHAPRSRAGANVLIDGQDGTAHDLRPRTTLSCVPDSGVARIELVDKAAVLVCRLAWNHPLPDGNKRAAWASLILFLDLNGVQWHPDPPNVDDAEAAMLAVAAHEVDEPWVADWLRARADFPSGAV